MRNSPNFSLADEVIVRALEAGASACSTAAPMAASPSTMTRP